jgi:hypothetical protein
MELLPGYRRHRGESAPVRFSQTDTCPIAELTTLLTGAPKMKSRSSSYPTTRNARVLRNLVPAALLLGIVGSGQYASAATPEANDAVEWTTVTAAIRSLNENTNPRGVAFFLLQRRLIEIPPGSRALAEVARRAESSAAVVSTGTLELRLPPGNFIMVWDPNAQVGSTGQITSPLSPSNEPLGNIGRPGPDALLSSPGSEEERVAASSRRRQAITDAASSPTPTVIASNRLNVPLPDSNVSPVLVAFNRYVRPPAVDFEIWPAGNPTSGTLTINLVDEKGQPVTRGAVRLRAHNGDLLDPVPAGRVSTDDSQDPVVREPGTFVFRDLYPQPYQAMLLDTPPPPPSQTAPGTRASAVPSESAVPKPSDRPANLTLSTPDFVHDGQALVLTMTVIPAREE